MKKKCKTCGKEFKPKKSWSLRCNYCEENKLNKCKRCNIIFKFNVPTNRVCLRCLTIASKLRLERNRVKAKQKYIDELKDENKNIKIINELKAKISIFKKETTSLKAKIRLLSKKYNKTKEKECLNCSSIFILTRKDKIFCNKKCASNYNKKKNRKKIKIKRYKIRKNSKRRKKVSDKKLILSINQEIKKQLFCKTNYTIVNILSYFKIEKDKFNKICNKIGLPTPDFMIKYGINNKQFKRLSWYL